MFSGCPSVCACVRASGRRHLRTGRNRRLLVSPCSDYALYSRVAAVADGPARRAASCASSSTQRWTLSVTNGPRSTVASTINLVRPTTVAFYHTQRVQLSRQQVRLSACRDEIFQLQNFGKVSERRNMGKKGPQNVKQ